ncbi:MAG: hypothetical protein N2Z84_03275 [Atribacterota bacterium]|nr:hypothetical protein [Atribacterota bacterium]
MKEKESYAILLLGIGISAMVFLSYNLMGKVLQGSSSEPVFSPIVAVPRSSSSPTQSESVQNFFLPAYSDQQLRSFRNIFLAEGGVSPEEELIVAVEEPGSSGEEETPEIQLEPLPEEESPQIAVKGMVASPQGRAVIVEVDGKIYILTSQKPLQDKVKLVKVDGKQVILEYQGRELTFSLAE